MHAPVVFALSFLGSAVLPAVQLAFESDSSVFVLVRLVPHA